MSFVYSVVADSPHENALDAVQKAHNAVEAMPTKHPASANSIQEKALPFNKPPK